jgi:phosphopantothenoylcysteine decarboxylase/phosphopantothenate--cysteine ligase
VHFVEPVAGELACKTVGTGKLEDVENIVVQALRLLSEPPELAGSQKGRASSDTTDLKGQSNWPSAHPGGSNLAGERLLITVGGTREAIDPVRFISNHSSGRMGFAVAAAAVKRGADVTVVAGVTAVDPPENVKVIRAVSAEDMHDAVMKELPGATVFVGAAAVADYAPANAADNKIKKDGKETLTLELKKTPDILSDVSAHRTNGLLVVGFAAETTDVIGYARSKLEKKGLDMVVANDITRAGAGFNTETNIATILTAAGDQIDLPLMPKSEMADRILDQIVKLRKK